MARDCTRKGSGGKGVHSSGIAWRCDTRIAKDLDVPYMGASPTGGAQVKGGRSGGVVCQHSQSAYFTYAEVSTYFSADDTTRELDVRVKVSKTAINAFVSIVKRVRPQMR